MTQFFSKIKGDYRQRTRSYSFLITLAISLYIAYTFVPPPDAPYTTVRIGTYIGDFNSAWIGHVTAIMTSVFLSLIGFFLVNNSVRKDIDTEVGMIIATTQVSNFRYLMSKVFSNFLVLLTIMSLVLLMSIGVFYYRAAGYELELVEFLKPYCFVTMPALFWIASLAVVAEVLLGRRSVLQYISFFVVFNIIMGTVQTNEGTTLLTWLDPFGIKVVIMALQDFVKIQLGGEGLITSMGFIFGSKDKLKVFEFTGMTWPAGFLFSRIVWIGLSVTIVYGVSRVFHRFDLKETSKAAPKKINPEKEKEQAPVRAISLHALPAVVTDYSIRAFIKTELLLLIRKSSRWWWLVNAGLMIAMVFVPLAIAHQFLLPVLWFLQVTRLSDLTTKEKTHRVHYLTFAAYQPLVRMLPAQLMAGVILLLLLALPLLMRYAIQGQLMSLAAVGMGAVFIVALAAGLGIASGGKKLFEILFFVITYANLNRVPIADYFGYQTSESAFAVMTGLCMLFIIISMFIRRYEISHA